MPAAVEVAPQVVLADPQAVADPQRWQLAALDQPANGFSDTSRRAAATRTVRSAVTGRGNACGRIEEIVFTTITPSSVGGRPRAHMLPPLAPHRADQQGF